MPKERADHPFQFSTQYSLIELTGRRAHDLPELIHHLKEVPGSSIYYHTHHFLKQHQSLSPEPANDIAYWVREVLQEDRLAERLAAIDTVKFNTIRALRDKLVAVIESFLNESRPLRIAPSGEEFHFMKSRSFIAPISRTASTLVEFAAGVEQISLPSLYYHIFEARLRPPLGENDFSAWLRSELEENDLAMSISRLDPYTQTLESLRMRILRMIKVKAGR